MQDPNIPTEAPRPSLRVVEEVPSPSAEMTTPNAPIEQVGMGVVTAPAPIEAMQPPTDVVPLVPATPSGMMSPNVDVMNPTQQSAVEIPGVHMAPEATPDANNVSDIVTEPVVSIEPATPEPTLVQQPAPAQTEAKTDLPDWLTKPTPEQTPTAEPQTSQPSAPAWMQETNPVVPTRQEAQEVDWQTNVAPNATNPEATQLNTNIEPNLLGVNQMTTTQTEGLGSIATDFTNGGAQEMPATPSAPVTPPAPVPAAVMQPPVVQPQPEAPKSGGFLSRLFGKK